PENWYTGTGREGHHRYRVPGEREPERTRQEGDRCTSGAKEASGDVPRRATGPGGSISFANERAVLAPKPTRSRMRTEQSSPEGTPTPHSEKRHSTPGPRKGQKRAAHARPADAIPGPPSPHSARRAPQTSPSDREGGRA
ncbi:hypothetical protein HPB47_006036, partial [Ixodes persulcatus]